MHLLGSLFRIGAKTYASMCILIHIYSDSELQTGTLYDNLNISIYKFNSYSLQLSNKSPMGKVKRTVIFIKSCISANQINVIEFTQSFENLNQNSGLCVENIIFETRFHENNFSFQ